MYTQKTQVTPHTQTTRLVDHCIVIKHLYSQLHPKE